MDKREAFEIAKGYINNLKANNIAIKKAYLFGSFIKGNTNESSDIDIALVLENLDDKIGMQVKLLLLRKKKETIIEPHPFDVSDFNKSNPFVNEIINTGVLLFDA